MTPLDSADIGHFHPHRKFYWTVQKRVCALVSQCLSQESCYLLSLVEGIWNSSDKPISNASQPHKLFQSPGSPIQSPATGLGNLGIPLTRFRDLKNTCGIRFPGVQYELLTDPSILFGQVPFHLPVCLSIHPKTCQDRHCSS